MVLLKQKPGKSRVFFSYTDYSSEIAPTGQAPAQAPQLMHESASITYLPPSSPIAPTGHPPAQEPHPTQESLITNAMIISSFLKRKAPHEQVLII